MAEKGLDVVRDFHYDSENEAYNRAYRRWRRKTEGAFLYRYAARSDERIYVAGKAVSRPDAAQVERRALMHSSEIIGFALLIYLLCEVLLGTFLIWLLRRLGFHISLDFLTFSMQGSQWAIAGVRALVILIKYSIPAWILQRSFKMRGDTAVPFALCALPESLAAIGSGMLIAAVYCVTAQSRGFELTQQLFALKDGEAVIAFGFFEVTVASLLAELLLRGPMIQVLRQFGDGFAVCTTAVIAFLLPNDIPERINELLIGLASGYLLLRSGSIGKCVLLRGVCTALCYARYILVYSQARMSFLFYAVLISVVGAALLLFWATLRRGKRALSNLHTQLSLVEKLRAGMQTVTALPWLSVSLLLLLIQMFY